MQSLCPDCSGCAIYWTSESSVSGALFRRIRNRGHVGEALSPAAVRDIENIRCAFASIDGDFAVHSLRSGFVTEAGRRKAPLAETTAMTGHRREATVVAYSRSEGGLSSRAASLRNCHAQTKGHNKLKDQRCVPRNAVLPRFRAEIGGGYRRSRRLRQLDNCQKLRHASTSHGCRNANPRQTSSEARRRVAGRHTLGCKGTAAPREPGCRGLRFCHVSYTGASCCARAAASTSCRSGAVSAPLRPRLQRWSKGWRASAGNHLFAWRPPSMR